MPATLYDLIPRGESVSNDLLLERFLEYVQGRRLELYPAQEAAILELYEEKNVILNTPTGSGKSLVAAAVQFKALAQNRRSISDRWTGPGRKYGSTLRLPQARR